MTDGQDSAVRADQVPLADLLLDPSNPRLIVSGTPSQQALGRMLYDLEAVDELIPSLLENGYFAEEPLVVIPDSEPSKYIVLEGNRRLTALKIITDPTFRSAIRYDRRISPTADQLKRLELIPCVVYAAREQVLPYLGFRHITGAKKWEPFQRARFIDQLVGSGRSVEEVQELIGDTASAVRKLYQDYVVFEQIKAELDAPEKRIRDRFSLLEVVLGQQPIKAFLGMGRKLPTQPVRDLVPAGKIDHLGEVVTWVFGTADKDPVIRDSRQISERLAPVLASSQATDELRQSGDLERAYEYSDGERSFLLKKIQSAERALQDVSSILPLMADDEDVKAGVFRLSALVAGLTKVTA